VLPVELWSSGLLMGRGSGLVHLIKMSVSSFSISSLVQHLPDVEAKVVGPQLKFLWQLFIKNTAPCELARGCIGGDA
jgi:hypothetical protein